MPQFWIEDFAPQMVWLVIAFVALYFLMARIALPRVTNLLETRHGRIADDLDQAAELKNQAEAVMVAYEAALVEARGEAQATITKAALEAAQEMEKRNAAVAETLAEEAAAAASRIHDAKIEALAALRGVATELALAAAERLLEAKVPEAEVSEAVDTAMANIGSGT